MALVQKIASLNRRFGWALRNGENGRRLFGELRARGVFENLRTGHIAEAREIFRRKVEEGSLRSEHYNKLRDITNETLTACPWAWFYTEFANLYSIEKGGIGRSSEYFFFGFTTFDRKTTKLSRVYAVDILKEDFGFESPKLVLRNITRGKASDRYVFFHEPLILQARRKGIARMFLEFRGLNDKIPTWFYFLMYLCRANKECRLDEIAAGIKPNYVDMRTFEDFPDIVHKSIIVKEKKTGHYRHSYEIKRDFYENIYKPLAPWLTENGYRIFSEWKKEYAKRKLTED